MLSVGSSRPNFFMVGAPRCATTTMYTYLKQHPDIYLSLLKEPIYFGSDLTRQPLAVTDEDYITAWVQMIHAQIGAEPSL